MRNRSSLGVILTGGFEEDVTPWAGAALLVELYLKSEVEAAAERTLPHKKSPKGFKARADGGIICVVKCFGW